MHWLTALGIWTRLRGLAPANLLRVVVAPLTGPLGLSVLASVMAGSVSAGQPASESASTVQMPAFVLPASDFASPQLKLAYARVIARLSPLGSMPAPGAAKEEWDKFDAAFDREYVAPLLAWNLARYPVEVLDTKMAGVHVGVVTPKNGVAAENRHRILINLHGGAFILGRGLRMGQLEAIPIASLGRIKVVTVDYRQQPYDKFPAASEDVESVYRELLKTYKPRSIGIYGCSAGGILTGQVVARLQLSGLPLPGAVGMFCAAPADFGKRGDSTMWGLFGVPQPPAAVPGMESVAYMNGADPRDPAAYPSASDAVLARFPPTLLLSGTRSSDMSPAIVAHARFLKLGVDSSLYLIEGGWHGAHVSAVDTPEQHDASTYIAHWFDQKLAK